MGYQSRLLGAAVASSVLFATGLVTTSEAAPPLESDSYACQSSAGPTDPATATRIMIVGDSATNESTGDYTWRFRLWKYLTAGGANVDLVGDFTDTLDPAVRVYDGRKYADCDFDQDHMSRAGLRFSGANASVPGYNDTIAAYPGVPWIRGAVAAHQPDAVIGFIGINDILNYPWAQNPGKTEDQVAAEVVGRTRTFVENIRAAVPDAKIMLMNMVDADPQLTPHAAAYAAYNTKLAAAIGSVEWNPSGSVPVGVVESPEFTSQGNTWDGGHPDAYGEFQLARAFAEALHVWSNEFPAPPLLPLKSSVPLGPRVAAKLSGAAVAGGVTLSWTPPPGGTRTILQSRDVTAGEPFSTKADLLSRDIWNAFHVKKSIGTHYCTEPNGAWPSNSVCRSTNDPTLLPSPAPFRNLVAGHTYEFRAQSAKGLAVATDLWSNTVTLTVPDPSDPPVPPAAVALTSVTPGQHSATVRWSPGPDATGYKTYWRRTGTTAWSGPALSTLNARPITGLLAGVRYDFAVRVVKTGSSDSALSGVLTAVPAYYALGAPSRPALVKLSGQRVRATWAKRAGATRYLVQLLKGGTVVKSGFVTGTSWTSAKLARKKAYSVRVRAYDGPRAGGAATSAAIKFK